MPERKPDQLRARGGRIDPLRSPEPPLDDDKRIDEAIAESFPASDPPSFAGGVERPRTQPSGSRPRTPAKRR
jgi:hypothetical protein